MKKNLEKLSTGYRINRAADDAAGLSVSERIRAQVTELDRASQNAAEGKDLAQTADAALQEVNDMLKRARSLCIQAANGTYSDQELTAISKEMNQLFGEIDRISASSYYNSICLFRGETEEIPPEYRYEYVEVFEQIDGVQKWGEVDFIQDSEFEKAVDAIPATATFTLSDEIDFNDPTTLEGKSIKIGTQTFYFSSTSSYPSGTTHITIGTGASAVEDALKELNRSSNVKSVTVDTANHTVTLTAALKPLSEIIQADGQEFNSVDPDGNGESINGTIVDNTLGSNSILQVDGSGSLNNATEGSNTLSGSFPLNILGTTLSANDVANLVQNTLTVYNQTITFTNNSSSSSATEVIIYDGMSKKDLGNAIATAISSISNYKATYDDGTSTLNVTYTHSSSSVPSNIYIYESPALTSSEGSKYDSNNSWTSTAMQFTIRTTIPTPEKGGSCTVTLPSIPSGPFSFKIGTTEYLYYNSDTNKLTSNGYDYTSYSTGYPYPTLCDTKGKTTEQIRNDIISKISSYASSHLSGVTTSASGSTITIASNTPNQVVDLTSAISSRAITVTPYKPGSSTYVPHVLNGSYHYFQREYSISFSLDSDFSTARANLIGRGFSIKNYSTATPICFEFTDGSSGLQSSYHDVDISNCTSFIDIASVLQTAIRNYVSSSYNVEIDTSGPNDVKLIISGTRDVTTALPTVLDGEEGITDGTPVQFEGGTNTNHSQAAIDFSSINENNLETLLGKGFRINCATCSGEYINVFFCWTNDGSVPDSFEKEDTDSGEIRTIHNVAVELSKVTSGDKIVESIVNQVRPSLNHYTDLMVGDPPTTLIAMEKRVGDVLDNNGKLYLGSVETGVETNFTYSVSVEQVLVLPPNSGAGTPLKTACVNIYVGSEPDAQWIPIHLPYIDLATLGLTPPEWVDLTDAEQSASDWLERVDLADLSISNARGTIGADYNRLEHAIQDLSNAHIQLSDAYSVIRDTDMAELMMKQVKDQILLQAQQAMLSQANQTSQGVLQLLQ